MNSDDRSLRLRYAIDLEDTDLIKAFELGGVSLTREEAQAVLTKIQGKSKDSTESNVYEKTINSQVFDALLSDLILSAHSPQKGKPIVDTPQKGKETRYINSVLLEKLKIASSMTTDDILDALAEAEIYPSEGEIGASLRKEGQQNLRPCEDKYMRNFLKGLGIYNRGKV